MINNNDHKSCIPENIISYIYSEMEPEQVPAFERHLAECSSCAEEFAAISDARFSVFEWKRDDFAPLATPQFEIPYTSPQPVEKSVGWFAGLLANWRLQIGVAAAFAALAAVTGFGFYYLNSASVPETSIATGGSSKVQPEPQPSSEKDELLADNTVPSTGPDKTKETKATPKLIAPQKFEPTKVIAKTRKAPVNSSLVARATPKPKQAKADPGLRTKMPTLNNFEDTEDDSLRLADLLADVDARNNK